MLYEEYLAKLTQRQKTEQENYPPNTNLKIHRALSWLQRSSQVINDDDIEFLLLWIAFNAVYADSYAYSLSNSEKNTFRVFLQKVCCFDTEKKIYRLVWQQYSGPIRLLLENQFVFQPFWDAQSNPTLGIDWQAKLTAENKIAHKALAEQATVNLLNIVFNRLYTLRNQLMHGGATWNSSINRAQIKDATNFMRSIVPPVVEIMMNYPNENWGITSYPVVK